MYSPAHKLGILAAPEAFAAGQQPDSFQKVRLALPVVAADDGKLPAGLQPCRTNIAIVLYFQRKQTHLLTLPDLYALAVQLDDVPGAALFAPHGADFAVHFDGTVLHQFLGFAAGLAQARIFQQGIQFDKFR